jgi:hypothetical protein
MGTVPKRGRGVEARLRCNEFPLYVFRGGAGEASSAGYGREAVKMPVYMPWPQSGRMQYEKIKIKIRRRHGHGSALEYGQPAHLVPTERALHADGLYAQTPTVAQPR